MPARVCWGSPMYCAAR
ncbi:MAG: hypothetical protein J5I98_27590 [Phaeodactylibacter sp.]|nr:hypothetical protein [Phaeodactylibacter sp.]